MRRQEVGLSFNDLFAPRFPCIHGSLGVFANVSDARGAYEVVVEVVNSSKGVEGELVYRTPSQQVNIDDPLKNVEIAFTIKGLTLPSPGKHVFRLLMNGQPVAQKPLNVRELKPKGE